MIKSDELRLWNFVFDKKQNKIDVIDAIEENRVSLLYSKFPYTPINLIEPVELTPDILEAAGCVYIDEIGAYYINGHSLFEFIDGIKFNIFSANDSDCYIRIKYLHQLQNLYWCLCGQELQIDLTKLNKEK